MRASTHRGSRIAGFALAVAGAIATFAVALGHRQELGGYVMVLFAWLVAIVPLGIYSYTLWRTSSLFHLYTVMIAVCIAAVIPLLNLSVGGEVHGGFIVAIVVNWVFCGIAYFIAIGFGPQATER